jgi:hypothetical protein
MKYEDMDIVLRTEERKRERERARESERERERSIYLLIHGRLSPCEGRLSEEISAVALPATPSPQFTFLHQMVFPKSSFACTAGQ